MLCQECRRRPASVKITTIMENQKTDMHLCEQCAKTRGELEFSTEAQVSLGEMLAALMRHQGLLSQSAGADADTGPRCAGCGLTYERFTTQGKLGCSSCFAQFDRQLRSVLRHIHGSTRHTGRSPRRAQSRARMQKQIEDLRRDLTQAVQLEQFERAAQVRDRIKVMEEQVRAADAGEPDCAATAATPDRTAAATSGPAGPAADRAEEDADGQRP